MSLFVWFVSQLRLNLQLILFTLWLIVLTAQYTTPRKRWLKVRPSGWLCEDGAYIARFRWAGEYVYLRYESKSEYEKQCADYLTFYKLKEAKGD